VDSLKPPTESAELSDKVKDALEDLI